MQNNPEANPQPNPPDSSFVENSLQNLDSKNSNPRFYEFLQISQCENLTQIIPVSEFNSMPHPLDIFEQIYSMPSEVSAFYGINDLQDPGPFIEFDPFVEVVIEIFPIRLVHTCIWITLIKIFLYPFTFFIDLIGICAMFQVDLKRIKVFDTLLAIFIIARILAAVLMMALNKENLVNVGISIWFIVGVGIEIVQFYFITKLLIKIGHFPLDVWQRIVKLCVLICLGDSLFPL